MTALTEPTPAEHIIGTATLAGMHVDYHGAEYAECYCPDDTHHASDWASRDFIQARRHGGHVITRERIVVTSQAVRA